MNVWLVIVNTLLFNNIGCIDIQRYRRLHLVQNKTNLYMKTENSENISSRIQCAFFCSLSIDCAAFSKPTHGSECTKYKTTKDDQEQSVENLQDKMFLLIEGIHVGTKRRQRTAQVVRPSHKSATPSTSTTAKPSTSYSNGYRGNYISINTSTLDLGDYFDSTELPDSDAPIYEDETSVSVLNPSTKVISPNTTLPTSVNDISPKEKTEQRVPRVSQRDHSMLKLTKAHINSTRIASISSSTIATGTASSKPSSPTPYASTTNVVTSATSTTPTDSLTYPKISNAGDEALSSSSPPTFLSTTSISVAAKHHKDTTSHSIFSTLYSASYTTTTVTSVTATINTTPTTSSDTANTVTSPTATTTTTSKPITTNPIVITTSIFTTTTTNPAATTYTTPTSKTTTTTATTTTQTPTTSTTRTTTATKVSTTTTITKTTTITTTHTTTTTIATTTTTTTITATPTTNATTTTHTTTTTTTTTTPTTTTTTTTTTTPTTTTTTTTTTPTTTTTTTTTHTTTTTTHTTTTTTITATSTTTATTTTPTTTTTTTTTTTPTTTTTTTTNRTTTTTTTTTTTATITTTTHTTTTTTTTTTATPTTTTITTTTTSTSTTNTATAMSTLTTTQDSPIFSLNGTQYKKVCKDGGKYFNKKCYQLSKKKMGRRKAKKECKGKNSSVVKVNNAEEQAMLEVFGKEQYDDLKCLWIRGKRGIRKTIDKSTVISKVASLFTNWADGHPDSSRGKCMALSAPLLFQWKSTKCSDPCNAVCSKKWDGETEPFFELVSCNEEGGVGFGESCYTFFTRKESWTKAKDRCRKSDMHLAEITSKRENDFVLFYLEHLKAKMKKKSMACWTGLNDREEEGEWVWEESGESPPFTFWLEGNPDGKEGGRRRKDEDCVEIAGGSLSLMWNDRYCRDELTFLCENRWIQKAKEDPS